MAVSVDFSETGEILIARNEFYALVARNRGFMVRHFYTEHEALEWLRA